MIRNRILISFCVVIFIISLLPVPSTAQAVIEKGMYIVDGIKGSAEVNNRKQNTVREEAKRMAYREAVDQIFSEFMPNLRDKTGYSNLLEKVASKYSSLVKNFTINDEKIDENGILHIVGTCKISESALKSSIGQDIVKVLDNPRILLLVDEKVSGKSQGSSTTHRITRQVFEKAGYTIVTPDQAKKIIDVDTSKILGDQKKLYEVARALRADIIIIGKASAGAFAKQKVYGVMLYGVSGSVSLRAIVTQTSQEINSGTFSASTGRKPAGSVGEGASRCLSSSASKAASQILNKVAYGVASAGSRHNDVTINIKLSNVIFSDVENIERKLRELAGETGEIFERSYKDNLLEIVFTSKNTAREVASFLSSNGFNVTSMTNWAIDAVVQQEKKVIVPKTTIINVKIVDVPSFRKSGELENLINQFIRSYNGEYLAKYQDKTLELVVNFPENLDVSKIAKDFAAFLEDNKVEIEGVSPSFIAGKLIKEEEKRRGLW